MKGLQPSGIRRRNKMIYAAVVLFLDHGADRAPRGHVGHVVFRRIPE